MRCSTPLARASSAIAPGALHIPIRGQRSKEHAAIARCVSSNSFRLLICLEPVSELVGFERFMVNLFK